MSMLERITQSPAWYSAGWTMLHFLWIGAMLGAMALTCRVALARADARVRYAVALFWMIVLALTPLLIAARVQHLQDHHATAPSSLRDDVSVAATPRVARQSG